MILLLSAGLAAGFIGSIIGGGGLITIPVLMLRLGVSPTAVGTNKVAAVASTLTALLIYGAKKQMPWRTGFRFAACTGSGAVAGAWFSPRFLAPFYPVLLWIGTGLCLATLFFQDRWIGRRRGSPAAHPGAPLSWTAAGLGFLCGLYDGAWGPGGGTFMLLALLYTTPLGLLGAIAAAKLSNFADAVLSLSAYAWQGVVHWRLGITLALSLAAGAVAGASLALKHAEKILSPLLAVVTGLLLWKLLG